MADLELGFEHILARYKGEPPVPTAVAYPCSEECLVGAVDAAKAGLIAPVLVFRHKHLNPQLPRI
jgi:phosphate acetyltransferase